MGRRQIHSSAADKQRAYRERQAAELARLRSLEADQAEEANGAAVVVAGLPTEAAGRDDGERYVTLLDFENADAIARAIIDQVGEDKALDIANAIRRGLTPVAPRPAPARPHRRDVPPQSVQKRLRAIEKALDALAARAPGTISAAHLAGPIAELKAVAGID